jgi:hypothetical protein
VAAPPAPAVGLSNYQEPSMTRSLYALGGLFVLALILFAQTINMTPIRLQDSPAPSGSSAPAAPAVADPATAIEDLAAWPMAAGH